MSQAQLLPTVSPSVSIHNGRPATTTIEVAKFFGKRHDNVIRSINDLLDNAPKEFTALNFEVSEYTDETGRVLPMFVLHRDGFMLLVMGYTGKKAMQIKVAYILAFNKMEAQLSGNTLPPSDHATALTPSSADDRKPLRSLVHAWAQIAGKSHTALWPQVKAHFQLARIDDLPVEWIPDALTFVQGKIDATSTALPPSLEQNTPAALACCAGQIPTPPDMMGIPDEDASAKAKRLKRVLLDLQTMQDKCGGLIDEMRLCLSPGGRKLFLPEKLDNTYKTLQHLNLAATAGVYMTRQALISAYHIGKGIEFC